MSLSLHIDDVAMHKIREVSEFEFDNMVINKHNLTGTEEAYALFEITVLKGVVAFALHEHAEHSNIVITNGTWLNNALKHVLAEITDAFRLNLPSVLSGNKGQSKAPYSLTVVRQIKEGMAKKRGK